MENMSPQQQDSLSRSRASLFGDARSSGQHDNKRRMKSLSQRRQSAPSLVITKALTRSRTLSRDCFQAPFCPETCPLVQSFLVWSDRVFLLHGHAQLKTGLQTQDRHLFLFNNMLVIAKAKSGNQFKQKAQVRVCEMWTSGCMAEVCEGSTSPESSFVMGWPTCNCVAMFSSTDQKEKWLSLLQSQIKEEKEKEEPKTIPLKVYGKGINSLADIKTLAVSNCDSTNEVVRLALQQFGIAGNVKDYQLWVFSKRDNAPYPLIGHEFPFSIQMGHVREPPSQGNKDAVLTPDRQMAVQAELLLQANKQCQFILKRRPASQQHEAIELSQKPFKRKRSIINWAFWKGSSSQLDDSSMSLSSSASGCLFGQPLSSVCLEDALPQPIMDMMVFLYHEGSWTRGIFRRSAGAKAVRELRDSLDSGFSQLPLTRDHVFIISGVFKDFLRNIPGSLLCSDRYEEWMDILDESQGVEEQAQDIQRLIVRLPTENVVLLRHLLCLLHGIQGNAPDNQMTSFNLSVCIAPSMLWPPGTCSPQLEGEMAKKVCDLVKFMIDHCQKITGQNPATLFGGPPRSHGTKDIQPDPWPPYPLTDSSFDSLENELDDYSGGSGGSPSFPTGRGGCRKNKPLQGSLDSILTLSDNDQDAADPDVHHSRAHQATRERCLLQLPPPGRPRGRRPAHPACPIISQEGSPTGSQDLSSSPEDRCYRFRRCSEPAIAYATELQACTIGSGQCLSREDGNNDDHEEEHLKAENHSQAHTDSETLLAARLLPLEAGGSFGLSSPRTSPAPPTRSPLDSLPSMCQEGASQAKRDPLLLAKTAMLSVSTSLPTTASTGTVSDNVPKDDAGPPDVGPPGPNGSPLPPRELPSKETLKNGRGLHPNVWLKDVRRPSLNQQDSSEKDDGEKTGGHTDQSVIASKWDPEKGGLLMKLKPEEEGRMVILETPSSGPQPLVKPESSSSPSPQGATYPQPSHENLQGPPCPQPSHSIRSLQRAPCPQPSHSQLTVRQLRDIHTQACQQQHTHRTGDVSKWGRGAAGSDINELKLAVPQTMVFGQTSPALALFRKNKTHSLSVAEEDGHASLLSQRRSSEPEAPQLALHLERFSRRAVRAQRLPGEPEAQRVSEVDIQGGQRSAKPPLCSSTCTAQGAVKDYVLSRPRGSPQSSQQMAPSLVESRGAWLRRCSDPMAPPPEAEPDCPQDLEQMFAEESFV